MSVFTGAVWRKSTRSNDQGLCVEVADNLIGAAGIVGVRDSKDPDGPALAIRPANWAAFVSAMKSGALA